MIYTVKSLTHVTQNHSRESLLVHASQNGICGADKCCFCGIKFLFPLCFGERWLFVVKYAVSWFNAILSHTFDNTGNNEIGLLLQGCSRSPSFGIGVTSAYFHPPGKTPLAREALMT